MLRPLPRPAWDTYLQQFHHERPGITEAVLTRCHHDGQDPYQWLTDAISRTGVTLDLACGSAPTRSLVGPGWVGVDASADELARAHPGTMGHVVLGDAAHLPLRRDSCDAVVCSMALMLIDPLPKALRELRRVMRPGALLHLLLPARGPLTLADRAFYAALATTLGTVRLFPPSQLTTDPSGCLRRGGFGVLHDESHRFSYPVDDPDLVHRFVESLYLPRVSASRKEMAGRLVGRWTNDLAIPLRRIIANTSGEPL